MNAVQPRVRTSAVAQLAADGATVLHTVSTRNALDIAISFYLLLFMLRFTLFVFLNEFSRLYIFEGGRYWQVRSVLRVEGASDDSQQVSC